MVIKIGDTITLQKLNRVPELNNTQAIVVKIVSAKEIHVRPIMSKHNIDMAILPKHIKYVNTQKS